MTESLASQMELLWLYFTPGPNEMTERNVGLSWVEENIGEGPRISGGEQF